MYYEAQNNKLGLTEFTEVFFDNISRLITNNEHISSHEGFYEQIAFKCFHKYYNSTTENYSINQILTIVEIVLDSMFKYHPSTILPEDLINIV